MRGENLKKEAVVERLRRKWDTMLNHLDERGRRVWAASEAEALGHGGVTIVHSDRRSAATGMSRSAITQGIAEMARPQDAAPPDRARMFGGGRKKNQ
jgi:chemotaxis response regulator CheB